MAEGCPAVFPQELVLGGSEGNRPAAREFMDDELDNLFERLRSIIEMNNHYAVLLLNLED